MKKFAYILSLITLISTSSIVKAQTVYLPDGSKIIDIYTNKDGKYIVNGLTVDKKVFVMHGGIDFKIYKEYCSEILEKTDIKNEYEYMGKKCIYSFKMDNKGKITIYDMPENK